MAFIERSEENLQESIVCVWILRIELGLLV